MELESKELTSRYEMLRDAVPAVSAGRWNDAAAALSRDPEIAARDAACLNLIGVVAQARHQWSRAKRFYGKAVRADHSYAPAAQNVRRLYELYAYGNTTLPIALIDYATMARIRTLPKPAGSPPTAANPVSLSIRAGATMDPVKGAWDWAGYASAIGAVALATLIGWPLVHSRALHLADTNVLMLYLLGVLWVATRFSRGAAAIASGLGVAVFDFVFVKPYYTFAVDDPQYIVTFAVMLLTAIVISTLTHRARQQSELARQAWERVETEFLRNTLLSGVSHDLRTPLAAIAGAASSLRDSNGALQPDARAALLDMICSETDRMDRLIHNLLDMTRLEAGGLELKKEWVPVGEIIGSALRHLESRLRGRPVKTDLPAALPMIQVDAMLFEQVLTNLVDNVIEYTPPDSPLEISARGTGTAVVIEVADRGPGLPAGTESRVFDKFFRAHETEGRRGIGLGLTIVRGIVEAHGGRVVAANRDGGGAVFRVTLPASAAAPSVDSSG